MKIILTIISFLVIAVFLLVPIYNVDAQFGSDCDMGGEGALSDCIKANTILAGGFFGDPEINLPQFIGNIIKFALTLVGSLFLLLIIYAGFQWMTAAGNTEQVKKAAQTMRNSVIGLVIIVLAYAVTITIFNVILSAGENL